MIGNKLEPFKFWCQKVLPNVYDDSLSYYEYLCKLNEYLNEVIEQINTLTDNMEDYETDLTAQWTSYSNDLTTQWTTYRDELSEQWQTYKTYIDTYFDNLDVQQEINTKLDQMALNGTLSALIEPFVGTDIQNTVNAWLTEHVDPVGSAVIVDNTLSITGAAADAKATGNNLNQLYSETSDDRTVSNYYDDEINQKLYSSMPTTNYVKFAKTLHNVGINTSANTIVGFPDRTCFYIKMPTTGAVYYTRTTSAINRVGVFNEVPRVGSVAISLYEDNVTPINVTAGQYLAIFYSANISINQLLSWCKVFYGNTYSNGTSYDFGQFDNRITNNRNASVELYNEINKNLYTSLPTNNLALYGVKLNDVSVNTETLTIVGYSGRTAFYVKATQTDTIKVETNGTGINRIGVFSSIPTIGSVATSLSQYGSTISVNSGNYICVFYNSDVDISDFIRDVKIYYGASYDYGTMYPINKLFLKADAQLSLTDETLTIEDGIISTAGVVYTPYQTYKHCVFNVNEGDVYYVTGASWGVNNVYKLIAEYNSSNVYVGSPYESEMHNTSVVSVTNYYYKVPSGVSKITVNTNNGILRICTGGPYNVEQSLNWYDKTQYYLREQQRKALYNEDKKNIFAWKPFDKAYISWTNDDARPSDFHLYQALCETYNFPFCPAIPFESIESNVEINGIPLINRCKTIVQNGGEILMHGMIPITPSSTEEYWYKVFQHGKEVIETKVECSVNGIIMIGGTGATDIDYEKGQGFCLEYYQYSDKYGETPQYRLERQRYTGATEEQQINAYKTAIDDAILNHKWLRLYCHGIEEVPITVLTAVFDYIQTKIANGDAEFVTWKYMYDTFRSTALENRISALE